MLNITNLYVRYGSNLVLQNFSLSLEQGEIYVLVGPSGSGKSTLLKTLCGILRPESGQILCNDSPISAQNSLSIGYVPQKYGLLDWKTAGKNILLPFQVGRHRQRKEEETRDIIASLGLEALLDRYPRELSGGQQQRVALARAFIGQPDLLLMDEPFSALDTFTSATSQQLFLKLWERYKVTTLLITHSIFEAVTLGRHILLMDAASKNIHSALENTSFGSADETAKMNMSTQIKRMFAEIFQ